MIHYLPLEHIDSRYTSHLDKSIRGYLESNQIPYRPYYPSWYNEQQFLPKGSFLNATLSCRFKADQLSMLCQAYHANEVLPEDIIFFSDLWFPGIEVIRYIDHFVYGKEISKIRGLLHAGSFTDTDSVRGVERWASFLENAWFDMFDKVFVGSNFIKDDVCKKRLLNPNKVLATGFPLDENLFVKTNKVRNHTVLFTGRNHPEKQPYLWERLKNDLKDEATFIWTLEEGYSREQYLEALRTSKVVVSFALQENFGFSMLEAAACGAVPIMPNRLVYPEFYDSKYLYNTYDECVEKVKMALNDQIEPCIHLAEKYKEVPADWFET